MRIAKVIGNVTLNRYHPIMKGATYKVVVPLSLDALLGRETEEAEELIAYDELGAAPGQLIAISEGREAGRAVLTPTRNRLTPTTQPSLTRSMWSPWRTSNRVFLETAIRIQIRNPKIIWNTKHDQRL